MSDLRDEIGNVIFFISSENKTKQELLCDKLLKQKIIVKYTITNAKDISLENNERINKDKIMLIFESHISKYDSVITEIKTIYSKSENEYSMFEIKPEYSTDYANWLLAKHPRENLNLSKIDINELYK